MGKSSGARKARTIKKQEDRKVWNKKKNKTKIKTNQEKHQVQLVQETKKAVFTVAPSSSHNSAAAVERPTGGASPPSSRTNSNKNNSTITTKKDDHESNKSCNSSGDDSRFSFPVHSLDHCESPRIAYEHIQPVLQELNDALYGRPRSFSAVSATTSSMPLRIWDPYYCNGSMKRHLTSLGFDNVHHEPHDFYDIVERRVLPEPPHDVFVTNPPYSEDNIERLFHYLSSRTSTSPTTLPPSPPPFCLLLPNWVARKKEFTTLLGPTHKHQLFYLSPITPYTYVMPEWNTEQRPDHVPPETGATTPYLSSWYISAGDQTDALFQTMDQLEKTRHKRGQGSPPPQWVVAKTIKGLKWKIQKVLEQQQKRKNK